VKWPIDVPHEVRRQPEAALPSPEAHLASLQMHAVHTASRPSVSLLQPRGSGVGVMHTLPTQLSVCKFGQDTHARFTRTSWRQLWTKLELQVD